MSSISPDVLYHSPEELGLLDIPDDPSESERLEAQWYLEELGWQNSPSLIEAAAKVIGAIDGYNWRQPDWVPQAHLQAIAQTVARYLADQDGTELARRVLAEQPQILEMAESLRRRRESEMQQVEEVLAARSESSPELPGEVSVSDVQEMIRSRRRLISTRSYTLPAVCFEALMSCGIRASLTREKLPLEISSDPDSIEQLRGRGLAGALSLVEELTPEAYSWLCHWEDRLGEISRETTNSHERVTELVAVMGEDLDDTELLEMFAECELTRSLEGSGADQLAGRLRLQLAVRMLDRARHRDPAEPPNVWL